MTSQYVVYVVMSYIFLRGLLPPGHPPEINTDCAVRYFFVLSVSVLILFFL